ncbi:serine/threonine protein kinase [Myxococcota bacterium]|nr:serine/threonine protein kinase [Myxococcota bacterium]
MSRLGRYTLLRRLAEGGMGSVYLAEIQGAANFTRRVAIKRILPHLARDPAFLSKFIDEANLMVQLHHGNIIGVQELADADGELYIVMDYLPGRDLKAVTRALRQSQRLMPPDLAAWIIAEVCAGLDYAHLKTDEQGRPLHIVHRDVSPSNILLGADGEVKVADFGIAQARGGLHKSVTGALQGKFVYMSPEQAEGQPLNARSDVFSAGLILYELLSNTRPFAGESETDILRRVRAGVHQGPEALRPGLDPGLSALVMRALAYRPEDRFESAGVMRRALLRYLAEAHSEADARALSGFLHTLFPEGVVPEASPPTPLSMDDALLLQLNGLTPSSRPAHVEGTPSALAATLSRPALTPSARWQPPEAPSGQWTP